MGRFSGPNSFEFHCHRRGWDYYISWTVDYYYASSQLRWPRRFRRWTDEAGARRFCRKHGLAMPDGG